MNDEKDSCHKETTPVENADSSEKNCCKCGKKKFSRLWLLILGIVAVIVIYIVVSFVTCFIPQKTSVNFVDPPSFTGDKIDAEYDKVRAGDKIGAEYGEVRAGGKLIDNNLL